MRPSRVYCLLGGSLWAVLLASGWHLLLRHAFSPGPSGSVPHEWPESSTLPHGRERPTLLCFAHRNCPCTRATLDELERILVEASGRARAVVVLLAPEGGEADRVGGTIEARAREVIGARVVTDPEGIEARRFHVRTSGHVLLYDAQGRLRFSGGITEARGHAGEGAGGQAILACLRQESTGPTTTPVYGCSLFADEDEGGQESDS
jgi:hypothetical protein